MKQASHPNRWQNYQTMAEHLKPAAKILASKVGLTTDPVLDIGSGTGNALLALGAREVWPVGLDREKTQLVATPPIPSPLLQGDAENLPFGDNTFTAAVSNFGIIFANTGAALTEASRVLQPKAVLRFTAWTPDGWPGPSRKILGDHLNIAPGNFPTELGNASSAQAIIEKSNLTLLDVERHSLRWNFTSIDNAVDTLTTAAGGLRKLREALQSNQRWPQAKADLATEIANRCTPTRAGFALDDAYLILSVRPT